ncbi:MAG TPA: nucleoside triphosphate pyrophosphohydrolase [bacterium]|nr:nucleoside triphosphate pyrophosphohydrolase [bacterium]
MGDRPTFDELVAIMARLRGPGGCPWDREQTHASLRPYLLEETYEALEAIDDGAPDRLREELGDLLLQVVFHAQMAAEAGAFTINDVVASLAEKLVRRHPHVFGEAQVSGAEGVVARWDAIKDEERAQARASHDGSLHRGQDGTGGAAADGQSALDGLARTLPALMLAQHMQARAARAGFTWPDLHAAIVKIREELTELERAAASGPPEDIADELGDLLFTAANLSRYLGLDGELALRAASAKFKDRFTRLEAAARKAGRRLGEYTPDELHSLWRAAR